MLQNMGEITVQEDLPGIGGEEVLCEIKILCPYCPLNIIIITGDKNVFSVCMLHAVLHNVWKDCW